MTQRRVDFDALHRARQEADDDCPVAIFGGIEYKLPASPPAAALVGIGRMQSGNLAGLEEALVALFGDNLQTILDAGFDMEDFGPIFQDLYGIDPGESSASGGSSSTTSRPSKQTSNGTTASTSPRRSGTEVSALAGSKP